MLCILTATGSSFAFQFNSLEKDSDKIAFLIGLKKEIPLLYSSSTKYNIDLFEFLDDQKKLLDLLNQSQKYKELSTRKIYQNLEIMPPAAGLEIGEVIVLPSALEEWRKSLSKIVMKFETIYSNKEALLESLKKKQAAKLSIDPIKTLTTIGFIKQKKERNQYESKLETIIACKKRKKLSDRYECLFNNYDELSNLPNFPSKEKLQEMIDIIAEKKLLALKAKLAIVLLSQPNIAQLSTWHSIESSIAQLNQRNLIFLSNKEDVIVPLVSTMLSLEPEHPLVQSLSNSIEKWIKIYANQLLTQSKKITHGVFLEEVPPYVGIFRGFMAGDCSSQQTFPIPNDPHERIFMVHKLKAGRKVLKGYVSTTEVTVRNKKALYVITISGTNLSSGETELILRGLEKAKQQLGVHAIILPLQEKLPSLINFPTIRSVFTSHSEKGEIISLSYQDRDIRTIIENFLSLYNQKTYDHSSNNLMGSIVFFPNNSLFTTVIKGDSTIPFLPLNNYSNTDIFDFLVELRNAQRLELVEKIFEDGDVIKQLGTQSKAIIKDIFTVTNLCTIDNSSMTVSDFKNYIHSKLKSIGVEENYLTINPHLMAPGYMLCQDALSDHNREEAGLLSINEFMESKNPTIFALIKDNINILNKTKAYLNLTDKLLRKLDNNPEERYRVVELFKYLKSSDTKVHLALAKLLENEEILIRFTALQALNEVKSADPTVAKALITSLRDNNSAIRKAAATAFSKFNEIDHEAEDALREALRDLAPAVRQASVNALRNLAAIKEEIQLTFLDVFLKDTDDVVLMSIRETLMGLPSWTVKVQHKLAQAFVDEPNSDRQREMAKLLGSSKIDNVDTQLLLTQVFSGTNLMKILLCKNILTAIKPTNVAVHLALVDALINSKYEKCMLLIAKALETLELTSVEVQNTLREAYQKESPPSDLIKTLLNIKHNQLF